MNYLDHFIVSDDSTLHIITPEGYIHVDITQPMVIPNDFTHYDHFKDNLGNVRVVLSAETGQPVVTQATDYYPFGMDIPLFSSSNNQLKYNSKELQTEADLDWYDYGARFYDPQIGRWHVVDQMAEKRNWVSSYSYCQNNPIVKIDPSGMLDEIFIKGEAAEEATKQLQQSTSLTLSRDSETGKISATGKAKTKSDKQLLAAINDKSITVNVTARNSTKTTTGANFTGGAFMGNEVMTNSTSFVVGSKPFKTMEISYNTVVANQEVNPSILGKIDSYFNVPGGSMLHEVTEAYEGGKISQESGISSPNSGMPGTVYEAAHKAATNQPGEVHIRYLDYKGNIVPTKFGAVKRQIYLKKEGQKELILNTF